MLEGLDLNGVSLVGFSMGGGEIARYLTRHGASRIAKTVLVASVAGYLLKDDSNPQGVDGDVFRGHEGADPQGPLRLLQSFAKTFYGVGLLSKPVSQGILDWSFVLGVMASPWRRSAASTPSARRTSVPTSRASRCRPS